MYVFERVLVNTVVRGGTEISWAVHHRFPYAEPWTFQVQWAPFQDIGDDDWVNVGSSTTNTSVIDTTQRYYSKQPDSAYRVILYCSAGTAISDPVRALGGWNRKDWLLAREVCRKEYLVMDRYTGTEGKYFARRRSGNDCEECRDWNTGEVVNSECENCYGTGIVDGYYASSDVWVAENTIDSQIKRDANFAQKNNQTQVSRVVGYPQLRTEDFWANPHTGERWYIQAKREMAAVRGVPIVWGVEMRLINPDNIVYTLPLDWNGGLMSSSSLVV